MRWIVSEDFIIYMILGVGGLLIGAFAGFKLGYAYGMRVAQGFNLTEWVKSLLPFGNM